MGQGNASERHSECNAEQVHPSDCSHCMDARATVQEVEDLLIRTQVVAKLSKLQKL